MRVIPFFISAIITAGLIIVLNNQIGSIPPLGKFLSPQHGFWQNAEATDHDFNLDLNFPELKNKVEVFFDDRMVPHVFAQNTEDLYFIQGYLHAKFRLWQMEFQVQAAAGRLTEVLGMGENNAILNFDRNMRRMGMVTAAQHSLKLMESDPGSKSYLDAYTAGVNAYIGNMQLQDLPLEFRLLNYLPEKWSNLKTALFLKYMSYSLCGYENDIEHTNARNVLTKSDYEKMYPIFPDSLDPIIPKGTKFLPPTVKPVMPASADSLYFLWKDVASIEPVEKPSRENGSNNWAVDGTKTKSGRPILCNDPHLNLNLPSLWFEMQLHTPEFNVYGVSFPGAPSIVIGFNDYCAWGVTNAEMDVKDYYSIRFKDDSKQQYWYNGEWKNADLQVDTLKIKGGDMFIDTVAYTVFGPVQYDRTFNGNGRSSSQINLAMKWKALDASNEFKTFVDLNKAKNYSDYLNAIKNFACPGQNFAYADKSNYIAIWQQGQFPAKWKRQGEFIMPGTDSTYDWQGFIPQNENPNIEKPERGFVSSANQMPADSTYPYFVEGTHINYRGWIINRNLRVMNNITTGDMKELQTNNYDAFAEMMLPVLLKHVNIYLLDDSAKKYLEVIRNWNFVSDVSAKSPTIFKLWMDSLQVEIWGDELGKSAGPTVFPKTSTLLEGLLKDSAFKFADNINTPVVETVTDAVTAAFKKIIPVLEKAEEEGRIGWSKFKDAGIQHLLRQEALSRYHLTTAGGADIINAITKFHGPSWRMVVQLTDKTEAYGIYPGGQSGNPGSKYYDNFVNDWAVGKYNILWVMTNADMGSKDVKYKMSFSK